MSFDFTMRRKVYRASVRTFRMVRALGRAAWKGIMKMKKQREKTEVTEYDKWMGSTTKENVFVKLKLDPNGAPVRVGDIRFDLSAGVNMLREAIQRNLREELNKTVGDSFLFSIEVNNKEKVLARAQEAGVYIRDWAPMQTDHKTQFAANTCILVKEPNTKPKMIPSFEAPVGGSTNNHTATDDGASVSSAGNGTALS